MCAPERATTQGSPLRISKYLKDLLRTFYVEYPLFRLEISYPVARQERHLMLPLLGLLGQLSRSGLPLH